MLWAAGAQACGEHWGVYLLCGIATLHCTLSMHVTGDSPPPFHASAMLAEGNTAAWWSGLKKHKRTYVGIQELQLLILSRPPAFHQLE